MTSISKSHCNTTDVSLPPASLFNQQIILEDLEEKKNPKPLKKGLTSLRSGRGCLHLQLASPDIHLNYFSALVHK